MPDHIPLKRLLEVAQETTRLSETEAQHAQGCEQCLDSFAQQILETARKRGRIKARQQIFEGKKQLDWDTENG